MLSIMIVTFLASCGFALMFNMPKQSIITSTLGAVITWCLYLLIKDYFAGGIFTPSFICSVFAGCWAFLLARINKAPFGMFFMIAVVPLIPGSGLYYTIFNLSQSNMELASVYARQTATFALAIACGVSFVWAIIQIFRRYNLAKQNTQKSA